MAFSKTPEQSTYRTVPIKFDGFPTYRSGSLATQRDCNIVNCFYDRISQENKTRKVYLKKRYGLKTTAYNLTKSVSTDDLRGYYYDIGSNRMYWAVNNKIYSVTPDSGSTIRTVCTLNTSSGFVGFCEFLRTSDNARLILASDGTDLWVDNFAASSCARVTDADMPTPHVPQPRVLNGYVVLAKSSTGDLYNSENDDPTTWTAGDYITAEMSGDYITMLAQSRNYIAAFGTNSLEIFWDSAQTSGSPFSRNDSGYRNVGYVAGLAQHSNVVYFIGQDTNAGLAVFKLDGFELKQISTSVVEESIQPITSTDNVKGQVNLNRPGYIITMAGHTFYVIVTPQATWAYDVRESIWYEWRNSSDTPLDIQGAWGMFNGAQYVAIDGQTYISMFSPTTYQDFGTDFEMIYTTERLDVDNLNRKVMFRLTMLCDIYQSTGTSTMDVLWSDDDWYSTTGTTTINLFDQRPTIYQLGQFITRSFRFKYSDNYPFRMEGIECEINIGTN